jgi:hypothetical protein
MPESQVVFGLIANRAELAGEIIAREAKRDQLRADLAHPDAAIRIMCPHAEPELIRPSKPGRKGRDRFGRQELPRLVLEALRAAEQPLSCAEIALAVMTCKGMVAAAHAARRVHLLEPCGHPCIEEFARQMGLRATDVTRRRATRRTYDARSLRVGSLAKKGSPLLQIHGSTWSASRQEWKYK